MIEIDNDIPVPTNRPRSKPLYPWLEMRDGDSFPVDTLVQVASARGSLYRYLRLGQMPKGYTMVSRKEGDGYRCWLTLGKPVPQRRPAKAKAF